LLPWVAQGKIGTLLLASCLPLERRGPRARPCYPGVEDVIQSAEEEEEEEEEEGLFKADAVRRRKVYSRLRKVYS